MQLDDFISSSLLSIDNAISKASKNSQHSISFSQAGDNRTVEFDIAVSAETLNEKSGKSSVKVLQFVEAGGNLSNTTKNSTVSRIKFGVYIDPRTKEQENKDSGVANYESGAPLFSVDDDY